MKNKYPLICRNNLVFNNNILVEVLDNHYMGKAMYTNLEYYLVL